MLELLNLVNEVSDLLYVADLVSHELLFVNRAGKEAFGLTELSGHKCYEILQGRDSPCPFCTNPHLQYNEFYEHQFTNPILNRHYLLKDKLIHWNGRRARVEIAFDITPNEEERRKLQHSLEAENLVTECARILFSDHEDGRQLPEIGLRVQTVLEKIGVFLESDRCYLFQIRGDRMDNTDEWCATGIQPQREHLQDMPISLLDQWQVAFRKRTCMQLPDLEAIRESCPTEYAVLSAQDIHSLIAAPIFLGRTLTGYLGVDNYAVQKLGNASAILSAIGYFIGAFQQNQKNIQLLKQMSYQDALTGLGNRNQFHQDIRQYCTTDARPMGVVYLDLNGMKQINDEYGHQEGDAALIETAGIIRSVFPQDPAYRNGGDEFVILCDSMDEEEFHIRSRELRIRFTAHSKYAAAIGSSWSAHCEEIQELLLLADERMYHDKRSFYRGKGTSGRYRRQTDDVLNMTKPGALQKLIENGQLILYFQPKIQVNSFQVVGAEALVRYELSPGNIIPPGSFIPILEESRLIGVLDFYVFGAVCRQMHLWLEEGRTLSPISINFSRYTLSERNFIERLQEIWAEYRVPKALIEIEVTETVEADDCYDFLGVIRAVKQQGFSVSIDDFGVKNANLSLFTSMDFDVLKIDKSLVRNLAHNEKSQAVLSSISAICQKMNIKLIVEGVETTEQLHILQQLHCDVVQGFLFSKPIPIADFEQKYL